MVPTNQTLVFHIPQVVAVAEAVKAGLNIGKKNGVDYTMWRSVITIMIGRFEGMPQFEESAKEAGIELTDELKRWSGVAIAKKAHKILNDPANGYSSKLLLCSARPGPKEDEVLHVEKVAGGNHYAVAGIYPAVHDSVGFLHLLFKAAFKLSRSDQQGSYYGGTYTHRAEQ